jgi:ornithine cyclodeaminase/alanine dehydrogenase-like protein (mu-crystallin family)
MAVRPRARKGVPKTEVLLVNQREVPRLLPMNECMDVMEETLKRLTRADAILPLRSILFLPDNVGALGLMPAALLSSKVVGLKAVTFFWGNEGTELDTHQGAVLLFEAERGRLLAVIDATSITAIRTAAVSGVATRLLARKDAGNLTLIGSGVQARTHLEAMLVARRIRRVRVASKQLESARTFAARESKRHGIKIEPVASVRDAVSGADIICTVTSSREPVLLGDWIAPGAHVNVVGSSVPSAREVDTAAVVRSRLFVDRRESTLNEAGDFLIPKKEGAIGDGHIRGEIGEVLLGKVPGRQSPEEITLFKSLGLAVEDVASARHIYEKARVSGGGRFLEFGGSRHANN